jgi:hypothetical protein
VSTALTDTSTEKTATSTGSDASKAKFAASSPVLHRHLDMVKRNNPGLQLDSLVAAAD